LIRNSAPAELQIVSIEAKLKREVVKGIEK